jgi:xylulose-5-phosphate/fructose-6-phosphate phosphoketolase
LDKAYEIFRNIKNGEKENPPFIIMKTDKGLTGPDELEGTKIRGNFKAHQIPLLNAKTDEKELKILNAWLKSYRFNELFDKEKGFVL